MQYLGCVQVGHSLYATHDFINSVNGRLLAVAQTQFPWPLIRQGHVYRNIH